MRCTAPGCAGSCRQPRTRRRRARCRSPPAGFGLARALQSCPTRLGRGANRSASRMPRAATEWGRPNPSPDCWFSRVRTTPQKSQFLSLKPCQECATNCFHEPGEMRIVNGKAGDRTVLLSPSAVEVLAGPPHYPDNPRVVPGAKPGTHMTDMDGARQTIRARAGLHKRAHPRYPSQLRLQSARARRRAADHRPAARSPPGGHDRALPAFRARLGQGIRRPHCRQHRSRYSVG